MRQIDVKRWSTARDTIIRAYSANVDGGLCTLDSEERPRANARVNSTVIAPIVAEAGRSGSRLFDHLAKPRDIGIILRCSAAVVVGEGLTKLVHANVARVENSGPAAVPPGDPD